MRDAHSPHLAARPNLLTSESVRVEQVLAGEEAGWGAWTPLEVALAGPGVNEAARSLDSSGGDRKGLLG